MTAVAERPDGGDLAPPPDGLVRQRVEQDAPQVPAQHLGTPAGPLVAFAAQWAQLDQARYLFLRRVAAQLPGHDDREQFLAGIDLILAGIAAVRDVS